PRPANRRGLLGAARSALAHARRDGAPARALLPQALRGDARALGHRAELRPDDALVDLLRAGEGAEAAVRARDHVLATYRGREPDDALGDQLRVLDHHVRLRDDAGDEHGALGQLHVSPQRPLVLVARVRGLERVGPSAHLEDNVDEVFELHVVHARADVDPVAGMPAHALAGNATQRMVERRDPLLGPLADLLDAAVGAERVVGGDAGIVDLQQQPGVDDGLVFLVHRVGDGVEVFLV